jgi:hypothetical protein
VPGSPDRDEKSVARAEEWGEPVDVGLLVRPYCRLRSHTCPVQDLGVETLVSTSRQDCEATTITSLEHQAIVGLCSEVRSVAEVAALLALPLGITRVLLADTIDQGLVRAHGRPAEPGSRPGLAFLQRVLGGLRRL